MYVRVYMCVCMSTYIKYAEITTDRGYTTQDDSDLGGQGSSPKSC